MHKLKKLRLNFMGLEFVELQKQFILHCLKYEIYFDIHLII